MKIILSSCFRNKVGKKVVLSEFSNPRRSGIVAANLKKGDQLTDVKLTDGAQDIVIGYTHGLAIRFHEDEIRRWTYCSRVRGIRLGKGDKVVGAVNLQRKGLRFLLQHKKVSASAAKKMNTAPAIEAAKESLRLKTSEKTGKM